MSEKMLKLLEQVFSELTPEEQERFDRDIARQRAKEGPRMSYRTGNGGGGLVPKEPKEPKKKGEK